MNLICFSHLRWNFVYQRPQHLLTRFSENYTIYYIEEPVFHAEEDGYSMAKSNNNIHVVTPCLNDVENSSDNISRQRKILNQLFEEKQIKKYICWYYSPMALLFSDHLKPSLIIYDCMDELSAFKFAPALLPQTEQRLFNKADVVFTGGYSLYIAKKHNHHNIYGFASSIDKDHFAKARTIKVELQPQSSIPHPRLGFYGVIDERFDINLIKEVADAKPEWQFVLIGPIIKIDTASLPQNKNIHYTGSKNYNELPAYLSGWDIALIPFAINESTKYISPTKTPEYLAAGKPVISTAIRDVVNPYGKENLVHIIHNSKEFTEAAEKELNIKDRKEWLQKVDFFLADNSWDNTWKQMNDLINEAITKKEQLKNKTKIYV